MSTYTVHAPPPRKGESAASPERFKFVRDGFYFWAFLLGPLWLLVHRLWLALFGYLVLSGAIGYGLYALHISQNVGWLVGLLIALAGRLRSLDAVALEIVAPRLDIGRL